MLYADYVRRAKEQKRAVCGHCGAKLAAGAAFCGECGKKLSG
jgi:predicted amidophosphoribosyltransferase